MRKGLDFACRKPQRRSRWMLRLAGCLAAAAAGLAAVSAVRGLALPRRISDALAVHYLEQASALREENFALRVRLAAHADDAEENAALRELIGSGAAQDEVWDPVQTALRWPGGFLPAQRLAPGAAVLDRGGRFCGMTAKNGTVELAGTGAGAVPCRINGALGLLESRGGTLCLTELPRGCAVSVGDIAVTAQGEYWVGTAAELPVTEPSGLTACLPLTDTARTDDYLYFVQAGKIISDDV
ncbi:MAG: hypothetical protein PUA63_05485 [Oscillospiraceae bacterium]|nr:hypothetical protein [Oscillospiraceae bacterium]